MAIRVFLFDINYHKLPANFHKLLLVSIRVRLRDKGKCAAEEQQRTEEGTHTAQEATPKAPARAVSTVITILRICFQFTFMFGVCFEFSV